MLKGTIEWTENPHTKPVWHSAEDRPLAETFSFQWVVWPFFGESLCLLSLFYLSSIPAAKKGLKGEKKNERDPAAPWFVDVFSSIHFHMDVFYGCGNDFSNLYSLMWTAIHMLFFPSISLPCFCVFQFMKTEVRGDWVQSSEWKGGLGIIIFHDVKKYVKTLYVHFKTLLTCASSSPGPSQHLLWNSHGRACAFAENNFLF